VLDHHSFAVIGSTFGFIPCLYFSVVTAATVGYGDIKPISAAAQVAVLAEIVLTASGLAFFVSYLLADRELTAPTRAARGENDAR
jgi:hypothetical protein